MVSRFSSSQLVITIDFAAATNACSLGLNIGATGDSARAIESGHYLGLEKLGTHYLTHLLGICLDTGTVCLYRTFPADALLGILPSERNLDFRF